MSSRRKVTSALAVRYLRLAALRTRHFTARRLQTHLFAVRNVEISLQSSRNRFREVGLGARVPARDLRLTKQHRVIKLQFARELVN